ncbi:uncharacterized protein PGTG_13705 [Puccinia graminis f. sp. tritici CRL 75-36-700-3]|uniref:Uncharacterized protein n=1 Tax=Puccinia graminis f. sp. tritici (strain CRL 75-36-700-3 / race SCCL) TaxID=418459 RepID=E3KSU7_PUCGT|nr:uncharacterized protein PGTG_13705 [Puccinia graminis f. sp. tritici CRL 75-36-700-3]EFP87477.1 hypothetical protein PGTG_13705 [Puccinia graminis f. sp. tritici CRL 75-36-700-3]
MVIKALNSENLKELEQETERKESKKNNEQTSLIIRFLDQAQPGEKPTGRSRTNRSIGSSIPLEPRVANYHRHPQISAQEDHQSSIVDRAQLLKSRAENRSSKKKKKNSETHSQKSSQPNKQIKKRKVSALSSSIKHLPDSLPNPGKSKKSRLTIDRHLPSQGIFKKAVYGSAGHTKRRNTWGGDLTFNELGFLDKERKSRPRKEEKTEQINKKGRKKSSSHSNISTEKRKNTISQALSKSSLHPSGIDPCKIRQGNGPRKSFSPSTRRHSGMPSSGHSAYSLRMREKAAKQTPQPVPSTSHQPDREETKQVSYPSEHRTCPTDQTQDGRHTHRLEQPPVEKSRSHKKSPCQSPPLSSSSHIRLIIHQPFSSRSSLTDVAGGYANHSFTQTPHRSSVGMLSPDDRLSPRTLASDYPGMPNRIDYQDEGEEEENEEEHSAFDPLSILSEGSEFLQTDENQCYLAGQSLPEEHYSRPFQSGRPVSFLEEAQVGPEYHNLGIDSQEEQVESDVYQDLLADRPELLYDQDDIDVDVDEYYGDGILPSVDDDDYGGYSGLEADRAHQTYQAYHEWLDEDADEGVEWRERDPPSLEAYQEDDVVVSGSELDPPGLDVYSRAYINDRYLVEPVVYYRPAYSTSSEDWLRSSVWSGY